MKELFKNKKTITVIKLILWLVLAGALYLFLYNENRKVDNRVKEYEEKYGFTVKFDYVKESLLNKDFDYLYIVVDDDIISYKGTKKDNKYTGTVKENNNTNEYKDLKVLNKKYPFLSLEKVFSYFNDDAILDKNTFLYEKDNLYVKIRVSIDNVVNIEINDKNIIYQLEISNIDGFDVKGSE